MKLITPILITIFAIAQNGQAQGISRNNAYLELGGAGFFYSVNYERLWLNRTESNIATRIGYTYVPNLQVEGRKISGIPVSISYLKKLNKKYFEVGLSYCVLYDNYEESLIAPNIGNPHSIDQYIKIPSLRIGIRKQAEESGLFWNLLLQGSLIIEENKDQAYYSDVVTGYFLPFLSFGIGRSF